MRRYKISYLLLLIVFIIQSCATRPPENPDNICLIFKEKRGWYKAVIRSEKRWKIPPYVLMSFVYQESSFQADARPEREKLMGFIPWFRPSSAVGYSQALSKTWEDYQDGTGKHEGKLGAFHVEGADDGKFFSLSVGSGLTDEEREKFWASKDNLIGNLRL
jgi:hypothetical protein